MNQRTGWITADPNPIFVSDYSEVASTTVSWTCEGVEEVEMRVDAPDGPLVSRTGPVGRTKTGNWVSNGMTFYLQDVSGGRPLTRLNTIDTVTAYVTAVRFATTLPGRFGARISMRSEAKGSPLRVLVSGWFSFEHGGATAGDLLSRDLVCEWLQNAGYSYDVALASPFENGVDWRTADPGAYSHVVFVCGPFSRNNLSIPFLRHFGARPLIGLNLSMSQPLDAWNPFDLLLERDSAARSRPDISFLSREPLVPVVGVVLVEPRPPGMHDVANEAIRRLLASRETAVLDIDTRLPCNATGLRCPAEVESLIARTDAVVTTRLHGMALALKNSVPAVAIDPYAQGGKILRQAKAIDWPVVFTADRLDDDALREAFDYCLSDRARMKAKECADGATAMLKDLRSEFLAGLRDVTELRGVSGSRLRSGQ
jgi:Polysaccharide pyruvyl transferase